MTNNTIYKVTFKVSGRQDVYEVVLVEAKNRKNAIKKAYKSKMRHYDYILCPEARIMELIHIAEYSKKDIQWCLEKGWNM